MIGRQYPTRPASRALRAASVAGAVSLLWDPAHWPLWLVLAVMARFAALVLEVRLREDRVDPVDVATLALEQYAHELRQGLAEDPLDRPAARIRAAAAARFIELDLHR